MIRNASGTKISPDSAGLGCVAALTSPAFDIESFSWLLQIEAAAS
jgi:hypothetical protein